LRNEIAFKFGGETEGKRQHLAADVGAEAVILGRVHTRLCEDF
jgi:hypothetical protein